MEKLRINHLKMILYVNVALLVLALIIGGFLIGLSWEEDDLLKVFIVVGIWLAFAIFFSILVPKTFSMKYDSKCFYLTRFAKEEVYEFKNVLYIDEPYTEKHKTLTFYLKDGKLKFISFDKDKKILDVFLMHCKNTISREEFIARFPTTKL